MKIVLYDSNLHQAGGEERLMLEHARHLRRRGHDARVLTVYFHPDALFGTYHDVPIIALSRRPQPVKTGLAAKIRLFITIRRTLRALNPDLVIGQLIADCGLLYLATRFTRIRYVTHIHGTILWFPDENTKYARLHRRALRQLRPRVVGHRQFYPAMRKAPSVAAALGREMTAGLRAIGVRRAAAVFTLSRLMAAEIRCLYAKNALVLRGAYAAGIFDHKVTRTIQSDLKLSGKQVVFNLNRLDARKRVDMLIRAFALAQDALPDTYLVIGGTGGEENNCRRLARELGLERVIFLGFVPEDKLWDYYATCDLFVHPNWADYALTVYEALALGAKILCSTEMEFESDLERYSQIFTAAPYPQDFSQALVRALKAPNTSPIPVELLARYTWERYFDQLGRHLENAVASP